MNLFITSNKMKKIMVLEIVTVSRHKRVTVTPPTPPQQPRLTPKLVSLFMSAKRVTERSLRFKRLVGTGRVTKSPNSWLKRKKHHRLNCSTWLLPPTIGSKRITLKVVLQFPFNWVMATPPTRVRFMNVPFVVLNSHQDKHWVDT